MKTLRSKMLFLGLAALCAAGVLWWLGSRGNRDTAAGVSTPSIPAPSPLVAAPPPAPVLSAPVAATPPPPPSVAVQPPPPAPAPAPQAAVSAPTPANAVATSEVAASERMYLAHAPLRQPEVADPDSEANRRILQTMVTKALAAPAPEVRATAAP